MVEYSARGVLFFGIPPYWFWAGIGFFIAITLYMFLLYINQHKVTEHIPMLGFGAVGLLIGAKLLGCITKILVLLQARMPISFDSVASSGIVFYGGLLGMVLSLLSAYHLKYKAIPWEVVDLLAICIPLFHSFARLGCFFGGCCYGKLSDNPLAILYETNQLDAEFRFPVQLYEACGVLVIFMLLLFLYKQGKYRTHLLKKYFVFYATLRFFLEFFRGDAERGVWGFISFSQIISLLILGSIIIYEFTRRERKQWKR